MTKYKFIKSIRLIGLLIAALIFIAILFKVLNLKWPYCQRRLNLILISIDTLRADHLSCYGYTRKTSPHIDALAKEGVMFLNTVSHSPKTTPSHMSMMTSLHHDVHQVHQVNKWGPGKGAKRLNDSVPTLAEILQEQGYTTAAFTGGANVHASLGFDKGFNIYTHDSAIDKVISWLNNNYQRNFFLFFHTYAVHDPYLPPSPYNRMYDPDYSGDIIDSRDKLNKIVSDVRQANHSQAKDSLALKSDQWWTGHDAFWASVDTESSRDIDFLKALYDGAINFMDDTMVGVLVQRLKELNIYENTLIVFTSDHGEAFGEHLNFLHNDLFWETLHVPLIIVYPKVLPKNIKIKQVVRLTDIMPTVFEIIGIKKNIFMQGESLLPAIKDADLALSCYSSYANMKSIRNEEYAYIKAIEYEYSSDAAEDETGEYKFIDIVKHEFLYNKLDDPTESNNIAAERLQLIAGQEEKLSELNKYYQELAKRYAPSEIDLPDHDTLEKLRSLGYL